MNLNNILEELQKYKSNNKTEILAKYIEQRLAASLTTYYKELDKSISYLSTKNELKLLKKLNKEQN